MALRRNKTIWIRLDTLKPHPTVQRHLSPTKVGKIIRALEDDLTAAWGAIGPLHIVFLDDQYWIVDGQHRWAALVRCGFGDQKVNCMVHEEVKDAAGAAKLFLGLNDRLLVGAFDRWKQELGWGDPVAVGARDIAESFGLRVALQTSDGIISCVNTLKKVYVRDDGKTLKDVLNILATAYGLTAASVEGKLIDGLAIVSARFSDQLDRAVLTKKLAKYPGGASSLLGDAKGFMRVRRGPMSKAVAEVIVDTYNVGRHEENRLSW